MGDIAGKGLSPGKNKVKVLRSKARTKLVESETVSILHARACLRVLGTCVGVRGFYFCWFVLFVLKGKNACVAERKKHVLPTDANREHNRGGCKPCCPILSSKPTPSQPSRTT